MVLDELNVKNKNTIIVLNKVDIASDKNLEELSEFLEGAQIIEVSLST
jgi:GTP-binding protein HflX